MDFPSACAQIRAITKIMDSFCVLKKLRKLVMMLYTLMGDTMMGCYLFRHFVLEDVEHKGLKTNLATVEQWSSRNQSCPQHNTSLALLLLLLLDPRH